MKLRFLLTTLAMVLLLPVLPGCPPDEPDPFPRGTGDDDDDDTDDEVGEDDIAGWVQFTRRSAISAENTVEVSAFAAYFQPELVEYGPPVPEEMDSCASGTTQPSEFDLPQHQLDVGDTVITLDAVQITLDEIDPELSRYFTEAGTEDWVPEQEYDVRITGGSAAEAATFEGALGTPEVLALTDDLVEVDDGLLIRWFGQNSNSHVELRFVGDPLDVEGEDEGAIRWVACKLVDDGQHTIAPAEFEVFDGDLTLVSLSRKRSTTIEIADNRRVRVVGDSQVHAQWAFPDVPGDDDDSGHGDDDDDDDSTDHDDDDDDDSGH